MEPVQLQPPPVETGEGVTPSPKSTMTIGGATYASDQIIFKFKSDRTADDVNNLLAKENLRVLYTSKKGANKWRGWCLLSVPDGVSVDKLAARLKDHPYLERVNLVGMGTPGSLTPVDAYYTNGSQWSLPKIGMPDAWGRTLGEPSFAIAILDTGISSTNPDLFYKLGRYSDNSLIGFDETSGIRYPNAGYFPEDNTAGSDAGHGTFVAGIAAAQTTFSGAPGSGYGIAGVSPNAPVIPVKVVYPNRQTTDASVEAGILDAISISNVRIINMSLGGGTAYNSTLLDTIKQANDRNVLVVGISGNINQNGTYPGPYPGWYWRVMAVGATGFNDYLASYSVTGPQVSVVAPGGTIQGSTYPATPTEPQAPLVSTIPLTPYIGAGYDSNAPGTGVGTSYAAPHVAGLAHLILSLFPTMTWYDLQSRIEDSAIDLNVNAGLPGFDGTIGWGRIDAERATRQDVKGVTNTLWPGHWQLVSIPFWPGPGVPANDKSQDWSILFSPTYTNSSAGFQALWYDPVSKSYLSYSDWRVPRVGAGRSYWVKFSGTTAQFTTTQQLGGAHPFIQPTHWVVAHLKPNAPGSQIYSAGQGANNLIGTPGTTPMNWNRQNIKVRLPKFDGSAEIISLAEAKQRDLVEQYAYHWNLNLQDYEIVAEPGTPNLPSSPYPVVTQMLPGEGYFVHTNVECQMLLPQN